VALDRIDLLFPGTGKDSVGKHDGYGGGKAGRNGAVWILDREGNVGALSVIGDAVSGDCPIWILRKYDVFEQVM
jgi:hypothetical protein